MRVDEAKKVGEMCIIMNETNWNNEDEVFYLISSKWFRRWKEYVCYEYVIN